MHALDIEDLVKRYPTGTEALKGVSLEIEEGEFFGLLGPNGAGKSTLIHCATGLAQPTSGSIRVFGHDAVHHYGEARTAVGLAPQELNLDWFLTLEEQLDYHGGYFGMPRKERRERARELLDEFSLTAKKDDRTRTLSGGMKRRLILARALMHRPRLLILDEPTAALSHHEAEVLFGFIRRLKAQGVAIIYITHRLDEVTVIADRVQVLRDGYTSLVADVASTDRPAMIEAMIGRRMAEVQRPPAPSHGFGLLPALAWKHASSGRAFSDVSLQVMPGEVVALFGKLGSGAAEVGETAFGIRHLDSGTLEVEGKPATLRQPTAAISRGVGFLPADRKAGGAFMVRPVAENVAAASWSRMATLGWISDQKEASAFQRWRDALAIRSRDDPKQAMGTLSGGNQQKVLLARWLERDSRALVLIEPTRGVDVGARADIYRSLRDLAARDVAVLVVTSDYEEAVQVADRAVVMAKGRVVASLEGARITTGGLLAAAGG
jgi:ribose transport system ATP-binding protein